MSFPIQNPKSKIQNPTVAPARIAAYEILRRVSAEKAFSAILLPEYEADLNQLDRALCHEIVLGTLRNQLLLDAAIENVSGKKTAKLDLPVLLALRIGFYQLKFLTKIPARAAVNESVNLVHRARLRSAANFVNAVLRKFERAANFDFLNKIENSLERLSLETSHPVWLIEKWVLNFGFEAAEKLARINNIAASTYFRLTDLSDEKTLSELRLSGAIFTKSDIAPTAWKIEHNSPKLRELVERNRIYIQDAASQLVANQVQNPKSKIQNVLDVCAAPGSKTTLIASLQRLQNLKSTIQNLIAGDFAPPRIRILRETCQKFAPDAINIVRYDATRRLPFAAASFDAVLVDAPCSGTGTIRHNPEIRAHLQAADLPELARRQLQILTNAARVVKTDGTLIYSTCSLEPEENEIVVEKFLSENRDFESNVNFERTFPPRDDCDGFFIARLQRKI